MRSITIILAILALAACGGGSSSGGGSQGGPAPTAFAGTYQGQFTVTAPGVSDTRGVVITVAANGRVDIETEGAADCVGEASGTPFLVGNRLVISNSGSCFLPGIGTCEVLVQGELQFSVTTAIGDGTGRLTCPGDAVNVNWGIGATKVS